jgi:hypothetical protein
MKSKIVKVYRVIRADKRRNRPRSDDAPGIQNNVLEVRHKVKHKVVKVPKMLRKIWRFWL